MFSSRVASKRTIDVYHTINRMLSGRFEQLGHIDVYSSILKKAAPNSLPTVLSVLARSMVLCANGAYAHALNDVEAVLQKSCGNKDVDNFALAVHGRVVRHALEDAENRLLLNSAGSEGEVSRLRNAYNMDLERLQADRPHCWLLKMARGELMLRSGNYAAARGFFENTLKDIFNFASTGYGGFVGEAVSAETQETPLQVDENTAPAIVAYQQYVGVEVSDSAKKMLKELLGLTESVDEEQLFALAAAMNAALTSHVYGDFIGLNDDFHNWESQRARAALAVIYPVPPAHITSIAKTLPHTAGVSATLTQDEKKKILSAFDKPELLADTAAAQSDFDQIRHETGKNKPVSGSFLAQLNKKFGFNTSLSRSDDEFNRALKEIENSAASFSSAETSIPIIVDQLQSRTIVNAALVREQLKEYEEAANSLELVIKHDSYIDMWKAFLALGRTRRSMGLIEESDAAYKMAEKFRIAPGGFDIPLTSLNAQPNAF